MKALKIKNYVDCLRDATIQIDTCMHVEDADWYDLEVKNVKLEVGLESFLRLDIILDIYLKIGLFKKREYYVEKKIRLDFNKYYYSRHLRDFMRYSELVYDALKNR